MNIKITPLISSIPYLQKRVSELVAQGTILLRDCDDKLQRYFDEKKPDEKKPKRRFSFSFKNNNRNTLPMSQTNINETKMQLTTFLSTANPANAIPQCKNYLQIYGGYETKEYLEYMRSLGKLRIEFGDLKEVVIQSEQLFKGTKKMISELIDSIQRGKFDPVNIQKKLDILKAEVKESAPVPSQDVPNVPNQPANAVGPYSVL
jgi:hypothetical protein